jgi:phosphoenolpyruvate-protein phosphotransferase (PTS system enzyme I)
VVKQLAGKPVTIRSFDVGADKMLSIGTQREEPNPALGLRAVRFSLAEPQMFRTQLRALLRASAYGQLRIMIPMISHVQELEQALAMLALAREELRASKQKFDEGLQVGAMIEVPAAALAIGMFRKRVSFLSLGTNDLIQYTLAIDRTDDAVVHLYDPLHPAVLKLIASTIQAGARYGMSVSVCGEMAGDPAYTRLLLGMGLREFSMHPANVLEIKQQLLHADYSELAPRVQRILRLDEPARVHEAVLKLAG